MSCYNLSLHRWQKMEPERCDMSRPLFLPKFFLWHLGSSCRNFGQTWQAPTTAAQKHRVIYALRHWHRRKTLHNDLFLRISIRKVQVNLFQKHLFLHQLTHNMTKDCSLNYKFSTWKLQAQNMLRTCCVHKLFWISKQKTICVHNKFSTCSEFAIFKCWSRNSMNNLSSYCGLVDAKISASDKDLCTCTWITKH